MGERSHYDVLGVAPGATAAEVRDAYRRAARDHHPDTGGDPRRMSDVNAAWYVLGDPGRRAAYDRHRSAGRRAGAAPSPEGPGDATGEAPMGGAWDVRSGVYRTADEWAELVDDEPVRPVRSLDGWWAMAPPATLAAAIGSMCGAFVFSAPGLLALAGGLFVLALGLFVLAPLRAMSRKD